MGSNPTSGIINQGHADAKEVAEFESRLRSGPFPFPLSLAERRGSAREMTEVNASWWGSSQTAIGESGRYETLSHTEASMPKYWEYPHPFSEQTSANHTKGH